MEPSSILLTVLDSSVILAVVDGHGCPTAKQSLRVRPHCWRHRIEYVASDMCCEVRAAICTNQSKWKISDDRWYVVRLAIDMVTSVRRRGIWETEQRRSRKGDALWCCRIFVLAPSHQVSTRQRAQLIGVLDSDLQLGLAWGIKDRVRWVRATPNVDDVYRDWAGVEKAVGTSKLPEASCSSSPSTLGDASY